MECHGGGIIYTSQTKLKCMYTNIHTRCYCHCKVIYINSIRQIFFPQFLVGLFWFIWRWPLPHSNKFSNRSTNEQYYKQIHIAEGMPDLIHTSDIHGFALVIDIKVWQFHTTFWRRNGLQHWVRDMIHLPDTSFRCGKFSPTQFKMWTILHNVN